MAARFLTEHRPFSEMKFGATIQSLMFQIHAGTALKAEALQAIASFDAAAPM